MLYGRIDRCSKNDKHAICIVLCSADDRAGHGQEVSSLLQGNGYTFVRHLLLLAFNEQQIFEPNECILIEEILTVGRLGIILE